MFLLLLAAAAASPEAERLGRELAASGSIEVILPTLAAKEVDEVIGQHPELSRQEQQQLRDVGHRVAGQGLHKLVDAFGHQYAAALSVADLRSLVAFNRTPAARHYRHAMPAVTAAGLANVGKLDFKADLTTAFCTQTGKLCSR